MMQRIDLHTHSYFSDGQFSPRKLVEKSYALGIRTLSITDHNILKQLPEVLEAGSRLRMRIISGVEITAVFKGRVLHFLVYGFNPENALLQERLDYFREFQVRRVQEVATKFSQLGIVFFANDAKRMNGGSIGKTQIASAVFLREENRAKLTDEGILNVNDFVQEYLEVGKPAHIPRTRMLAEEAISLAHQAGGKVFLAHPGPTLNKNFNKEISFLVDKLYVLGLDGIEVFHPENNRAVTMCLRSIVRNYDFLESAGSDYHGSHPSHSHLRLGEWNNFGLKPNLSWLKEY